MLFKVVEDGTETEMNQVDLTGLMIGTIDVLISNPQHYKGVSWN